MEHFVRRIKKNKLILKIKEKFCCFKQKDQGLSIRYLRKVMPKELVKNIDNEYFNVTSLCMKGAFWIYLILQIENLRVLIKNQAYFGIIVQWSVIFIFGCLLWLEVDPKWKTTLELVKVQLMIIRNCCILIDPATKTDLKTDVDQLMEFCITFCVNIYFLMSCCYLNLGPQITIPLYMIDSVICVVTLILWEANGPQNYEMVFSQILSNPTKTL
jgi:hypothetical protein